MASVTNSENVQNINDWNEDEISAFLTRKNGLFKLKNEEILAIHETGIDGAALVDAEDKFLQGCDVRPGPALKIAKYIERTKQPGSNTHSVVTTLIC